MSSTIDTSTIYDMTHRQVTRTAPGLAMAEYLWQDWGGYVGQLSWATRDQLDELGESAGLGPGCDALDLCCGTGGVTRYLAETTGAHITGVDYSRAAIAIANEALPPVAGWSHFTNGDARSLPFADRRFDGLLCVDSLVIVPSRARVLAECARVLRPGGRLAFSDEVVLGRLPRDPAVLASLTVYGRLYPQTPAGYQRMLGRAGLVDVLIEDSTETFAAINDRWARAYRRYEDGLRDVLGDALFDDGLRFFEALRDMARAGCLGQVRVSARRPA